MRDGGSPLRRLGFLSCGNVSLSRGLLSGTHAGSGLPPTEALEERRRSPCSLSSPSCEVSATSLQTPSGAEAWVS